MTPLTFSTPLAGGLRASRRWCVLAVAALLLPAAALAGETQAPVTVTKVDGAYVVRAEFVVPQSPDDVLAVLSDYENIPRFLPDIRRSLVRSRDGARTVVEQEAVSGMMMFSKTVHLVLEIDESADALTFRDICGQSFEHYSGHWQLSRAGDSTMVRYELRARPAFTVPEFVLRRLLKRDARETISRIAQEIARRAAMVAFTSR